MREQHHAAFVPALGAGVVDLLDAKPGERTLRQYIMDISSLGIVPVRK